MVYDHWILLLVDVEGDLIDVWGTVWHVKRH